MSGTTEWTVGLKYESAGDWDGAASQLAADDGLLIESESMPTLVPEPIEDANVGDSLAQGHYQGNIGGEGTLVIPARFEGAELIIGLLFGEAYSVIDSPGETAGTAKDHPIIFQDSNSGILASLVYDKGITDEIWEYSRNKASQLEFNHANGKLMLTPTLIPRECLRAGQTNDTSAEVAVATPRTRSLLALFNSLQVGLLEVTGSEDNIDLATDEIKVTNAQLTINRNITGIQESGSDGKAGEPETDGLPTAQLTLSLADYAAANDALIQAAQTRQDGGEPVEYKIELHWTGKEIAGSDAAPKNHYKIIVQLPSARIATVPVNAGGPGARVGLEISFNITTPQVVVDGTDWAWVVAGSTPMKAIVRNEETTAAIT